MVLLVRKSALPAPTEVTEGLREAAAAATSVVLREHRPPGFPLFFSATMEIIEPAVAFLHEHAIQRAHTADAGRGSDLGRDSLRLVRHARAERGRLG
jgi:integrase/recombinase XerD